MKLFPPGPKRRIPRRPYRDSAIFNALLALLVVGVAIASGGGAVRAVIFAAAAFVIATAWSWWRFRTKIEQERGRR